MTATLTGPLAWPWPKTTIADLRGVDVDVRFRIDGDEFERGWPNQTVPFRMRGTVEGLADEHTRRPRLLIRERNADFPLRTVALDDLITLTEIGDT